jgi:urease subunit alpha
VVMISRKAYAEIYGPTKGDMIRLGDTELIAEIEHDYAIPGDELASGAGKSMRDGEGYQTSGTYASGALDMVIHNATIIDAILGIVKGDIGIRDGRIVGVGKAGNPDIMDGVHPDLRTDQHDLRPRRFLHRYRRRRGGPCAFPVAAAM